MAIVSDYSFVSRVPDLWVGGKMGFAASIMIIARSPPGDEGEISGPRARARHVPGAATGAWKQKSGG